MMNYIESELKKLENRSITENGAVGYKTTESALVDMNYLVSSFRNRNEDEIISYFDKAFNENKEYALKWLFYARDVRGGLGERRLFRVCYGRLLDLDVDLFYKNLHNIQEYGRWDDLVSLIGLSQVTDEYITHIIKLQLGHDLHEMKKGNPISLLGKWLPSENASSKKTKHLAKVIRSYLRLSSRDYRLILSKLRKYLNVVEVKMCGNEWESIDYNSVPSLANLKYKDAFLRHDNSRRMEYLESVRSGKSKMNMGVATPVDIVSKYYSNTWGTVSEETDDALELAWDNLKDVLVEDTLVVADGSGSMYNKVNRNSKVQAIHVANALAIYTSEHNSGVYKNKYITFSQKPQFVNFGEDWSLRMKLQLAREYNEMANTNIEAVFMLILKTAVDNNLSSDEMVKNILIISDMEFDAAQTMGSWRYRDDICVLSPSLFETINQKYIEHGYKLPKLVFWNVCSRTGTIPMIENELGVILVSGFSQNILEMVMSNKCNPYDALIETITNERYDKVVVG